MSSSVSPASATAASHASMVSDSGGTISRRPICDMPMPVIAERVLELLRGQQRPDMRPKSCGAISSSGCGPVCLLRGRPEERQPDVLDLLEHDLDRLTQLAARRVRSRRCWWSTEPAGPRRWRPGPPRRAAADPGKPKRWLTVKARQRGLAGDVAHAHVAAAAVPAHRLRRMDQRIAVPALLDAQDAVCARGPEELVLRV